MNIWTLLPHVSYCSITTMTHCLYSPTQGFVAYIFLNECDFFKWMIIHILSSNVIYPKTTIYSREMYVFFKLHKSNKMLSSNLFVSKYFTYLLLDQWGRGYAKTILKSWIFFLFICKLFKTFLWRCKMAERVFPVSFIKATLPGT